MFFQVRKMTTRQKSGGKNNKITTEKQQDGAVKLTEGLVSFKSLFFERKSVEKPVINLMKKDKISNSQMLSFIWVEGVNNQNIGN